MSDEIAEEMPWKLPVAAAMLGALLTAIYVIFTIVNAPPTDPDVSPSDAAVEASGFPSGYVPVSSDVAMRGDVLRWDSTGTTVLISSATRGEADPSAVTPIEVAAWSLTTIGGEASMVRQSMSEATPGAVTVELNPVEDVDSLTLNAVLPGSVEDVEDVMTIPAEFPVTVADHRIVFDDDAVIVVDMLVDADGGWIRWHLEGGVAAKLDVLVSVDGAAYATSSDGTGSPRLWGQRDAVELVMVGGESSTVGTPMDIAVEMSGSVAATPGEQVEVPIGSVVGP